MFKAYRALEDAGLIESRPGQGTFVTRTPAGPSLARYAELRREMLRWLRRARTDGPDAESLEALFDQTAPHDGPHRVAASPARSR